MKYFLHDCNAFNDEKVSELFLNFGYEGLGLFYTILEKIGSQEKPIKTVVLKNQLKVGKKLDKCWEFMESLGMISSNNGDTFNERILSYSKTYQIKKEKTKEKISQWRENQLLEKNVTGYELNCNHLKVKESKVNEIEVNRANALTVAKPAEVNQQELKNEFKELIVGITGKELKIVVAELKTFISDKKPEFIDPYQEYWNLFAENYQLSGIQVLNDSRIRKFKTRIREPAFDFLKLLDKIKYSKQLRGQSDSSTGWKVTFDWVFENQSNYVKILEGNYDSN